MGLRIVYHRRTRADSTRLQLPLVFHRVELVTVGVMIDLVRLDSTPPQAGDLARVPRVRAALFGANLGIGLGVS